MRPRLPSHLPRLGLAAGLALAATLSTGVFATAANAEPGPDVAVAIHGRERHESGAWAQVTLEVFTADTSSAQGVRLTAAFPLEVNVLHVDPHTDGWDCSATHGRLINCVRTDGEDSGRVAVQVLMPGYGPERLLRVTAAVDTPLADPNPANNTAARDFVVEAGTNTLAGRVWHDRDGDGLRGGRERGVRRALIRLQVIDPWHDNEIVQVDEARSRADGRFTFGRLAAGEYRIEVVTPGAGWDFTRPDAGDDSRDSDVAPEPGQRQVAVSTFRYLSQRETAVFDAGLVKRR